MKVQVVTNRRGIFFREPDGTITTILPHYRGDFHIRQVNPERGYSFLSTYSDSGTVPFAALIKFLLLTKSKIPPIPKATHEVDRYSQYRFESAASEMITTPFPLQVGAELKGGGGIEFVTAHFVKVGREPRIVFKRKDNSHISISIPLAQSLVRIMPQIAGESTGPFRFARDRLVDAVRAKTFEPHKKSVMEPAPRQREFNFAKKDRKERWKAKAAIKRTRRNPIKLNRFHLGG